MQTGFKEVRLTCTGKELNLETLEQEMPSEAMWLLYEAWQDYFPSWGLFGSGLSMEFYVLLFFCEVI